MSDREYTTERHDLRQALEELSEAGYDVTCPPPGADDADAAARVRIARGEDVHVEGTGASADAAFAAALERLEAGGR